MVRYLSYKCRSCAIHMYIFGHYSLSVWIIDLVSQIAWHYIYICLIIIEKRKWELFKQLQVTKVLLFVIETNKKTITTMSQNKYVALYTFSLADLLCNLLFIFLHNGMHEYGSIQQYNIQQYNIQQYNI